MPGSPLEARLRGTAYRPSANSLLVDRLHGQRSFQVLLDDRPVEIVEEGLDVLGARASVVDPIGMLIDIQSQNRCGIPERECVLRVTDHGGEGIPVVIIGEPYPPTGGDPRGLEVLEPAFIGRKVSLDIFHYPSGRRPALAAQM